MRQQLYDLAAAAAMQQLDWLQLCCGSCCEAAAVNIYIGSGGGSGGGSISIGVGISRAVGAPVAAVFGSVAVGAH
jgi:hypothetical protein